MAALGEKAEDPEAVRLLIDEEIKRVNHMLETYKFIRAYDIRTTEFEKTTSKKIRRKYA